MKKILNFDFLIIGSGVAGLSSALHLAKKGKVAIVTKLNIEEANTKYAQGGIACVIDKIKDSFDIHYQDTLIAGCNVCNKDVVKKIIKNGPNAIDELIKLGINFTKSKDVNNNNNNDFDLGKEGGHSQRRVLHSGDITGEEIELGLVNACKKNDNIEVFENHIAIDLLSSWRNNNSNKNCVLGAFVLDIENNQVLTFKAYTTIVACGGAGKVYLYTSNPDIACGAGVAMCYRVNAQIANMEFFQFHPTILFHPKAKSFLISEAVRGEGGVLKMKNKSNKLVEFMDKYHHLKSLAPRDIVARAIDNELKKSGNECVFIDITHKDEIYLKKRFPNIFKECMKYDINMAKDPIPVVPAAHYACGGVKTDVNGYTNIQGLYVVGESAHTGFHGANRLASNSLLEAIVVSKLAAIDISKKLKSFKIMHKSQAIQEWTCGEATNSDELVVISHNWDEIRHFMWDYVGIVRTQKRLERAKTRIKNLRYEINRYYWDFNITSDLIELRNIASVAEIIIDSALQRKESRGLHFNSDYPKAGNEYKDTIISRTIK